MKAGPQGLKLRTGWPEAGMLAKQPISQVTGTEKGQKREGPVIIFSWSMCKNRFQTCVQESNQESNYSSHSEFLQPRSNYITLYCKSKIVKLSNRKVLNSLFFVCFAFFHWKELNCTYSYQKQTIHTEVVVVCISTQIYHRCCIF